MNNREIKIKTYDEYEKEQEVIKSISPRVGEQRQKAIHSEITEARDTLKQIHNDLNSIIEQLKTNGENQTQEQKDIIKEKLRMTILKYNNINSQASDIRLLAELIADDMEILEKITHDIIKEHFYKIA